MFIICLWWIDFIWAQLLGLQIQKFLVPILNRNFLKYIRTIWVNCNCVMYGICLSYHFNRINICGRYIFWTFNKRKSKLHCFSGFVYSNFVWFIDKGVDEIINFAYPPLAFVYPITITLVIYIVLFGKTIKSKTPYIFALIASTIIAIFRFIKIIRKVR